MPVKGNGQRRSRSAGARSSWPTLIATVSMLGISSGVASAAPDGVQTAALSTEASNAILLRKLEAMERRIQTLEGELKHRNDTAQAGSSSPKQDTAPAGGNAKRSDTANPQDAATTERDKRQQKAKTPQTASGKDLDLSNSVPSPTPTAPPGNGLLGLADSPVPGLSIGAYGEVKFGARQNPSAGGQWQNGFDLHRMVLLPTYAITPNIIFNAEIEFEHGGSAFDTDDKRHGTAEIEQIWVDFKIIDQFNIRSPGVDLVPIGYINQHHEPTQFYSVNRPQLYNGLIPSTWMVPAASAYGRIADGVSYQFQVSSSIEDFGDSFDKRTDANTVAAGGYVAGITGASGLGSSRPVIGDFRQLSNTMAYAGKLDFSPPFVPGLAWSVSSYYTPNVTPRGAYSDTGMALGKSSMTMFDGEFRYRVPNTGFEFRGEYVHVSFGNPANLRANNDTDPTNNVGKTMFGYSGEIAYHIAMGTILGSEWEAVPFYNYTYQNLQTSGFAGTDLNAPTGAGQAHFHTMGVAIFPSPKLVLKATYQKVKSNDPAGANADSILGGVGFFF